MSNLFFSFPITKAENMNIFRVQFLHVLLSEEIRLVGIEFGYNLSSNSLSPFFFFLVCVKLCFYGINEYDQLYGLNMLEKRNFFPKRLKFKLVKSN